MVEFKRAPQPPEPVIDAGPGLAALGWQAGPLGAAVAAIGAGFALWGLLRLAASLLRFLAARRTVGRVVGFDRAPSGRTRPIIAFDDADGQRHDFVAPRRSARLHPGRAVTVRHHRRRPREAECAIFDPLGTLRLLWPLALGAGLVALGASGRIGL